MKKNIISIKLLKCKARKEYLKLVIMRDDMSCGGNLARYISSRVSIQEQKLKNVMEKLRKIDPNFPVDVLVE